VSINVPASASPAIAATTSPKIAASHVRGCMNPTKNCFTASAIIYLLLMDNFSDYYELHAIKG
jgi:hypothetical protein